jgi:hypothetical protein
MTLDGLEERVRHLEDIRAIEQLQTKLIYANDDGDWQGLAELFVEDGIDEIGKFFKGIPDSLPFRFHTLANPIIKIEGEEASGRWAFRASVTQAPANRACWIAGEYICDYVKVNGEWKFKKVANRFHYITPYNEGWVKTKMC